MKQYLELLKTIKEEGVYKPPAREGMPGSQSLFGYQFRHNLANGFPLLTTKKMFWKGVVVELLWFLRGDTNIKYLVDNGVNIWNEDAYNYYKKLLKSNNVEGSGYTFDEFIQVIKEQGAISILVFEEDEYKLGDCGYQYGRVWRNWMYYPYRVGHISWDGFGGYEKIDQIHNLIEGLKNNPESRRHIVTAIDPANDKNLALYWCHAMFQFNCRPLAFGQRYILLEEQGATWDIPVTDWESIFTKWKIPKYYLDCQLYQRSADAVLGVPFNIASYALLTHIIAKICNMVPGEFIHTFGDVHIYDNHKDAVNEQLSRIPDKLPELIHMKTDAFWKGFDVAQFNHLEHSDFQLSGYNPQSAIKAELSTGLKK